MPSFKKITKPVAELTHFNQDGNAHMVDVGEKDITERSATATGRILLDAPTLERVKAGNMAKGDVLSVARIAGIMGVKRTADLVPLCHPLPLTHVSIDFDIEAQGVRATVTAKCSGKTGVEMEAINGVQIALLTIFDMCKAMDKSMTITDVRLLEKKGGKSGHFIASEPL